MAYNGVLRGAGRIAPVAIHHDNFALWRSDATRWNAVDMGPGRDLTGELEQAIHGRGMKFMAAKHHAMTWFYFEQAYQPVAEVTVRVSGFQKCRKTVWRSLQPKDLCCGLEVVYNA